MATIQLTDADRIAGLLSANQTLNQRVVDLEVANAAMRRVLVEREVTDAKETGEKNREAKPAKP